MSLVLSDGTSLYSASFNLNELGNAQLEFQENPLNLPTPFDSALVEPQIVGSCHGLLCLRFPKGCLLWNPSTRTHHVLPNPPYDEEKMKKDDDYVVHGLGYDEMNDDFKFMTLFGCQNGVKTFNSEVWEYSLNSNSWKVLAEFPYHVQFGREVTDVFVNGSLHYIVNRKTKGSVEGEIIESESLIAAFDVSAETYQLIPNPNSVNLDQTYELGVLDGCLCMILNVNDAGKFQLLEMKEYGNGLSWIELFRFERNDGPFWMRPITSLLGNENQKQVLMEGGLKLFCFDVGSNSFKDIDAENNEFVEVCVCMESQRILDTADDDN